MWPDNDTDVDLLGFDYLVDQPTTNWSAESNG
jgi:hypothetical protein